MSKMSEKMIDEMNHHIQAARDDYVKYGLPCGGLVVLRPGEVWVPSDGYVQQHHHAVKEECTHVWYSVTLLTSIVDECKKCGILRKKKKHIEPIGKIVVDKRGRYWSEEELKLFENFVSDGWSFRRNKEKE